MACLLIYFMMLGMPVQIALAGIGDGSWTTPVGNPTIDAPGGTADAKITLNDLQTIINWYNFNTVDGQLVNFLKSIAGNPAVLNRITGGGMTQFNGDLSALGIDVFIINTRGITFGPTSYVTARNLVVSGIDIKNNDFMNGDFQFKPNLENYYGLMLGDVEAGGTIEAENMAALIGKNVTNKGTIKTTAPGGVVVMAAGKSIYLNEIGSNVAVQVDDMLFPENYVVNNEGTIGPETDKVILAAGDIFSAAIEGVESLRAEAKRDITLEGDITASDHVEILGGQNGGYVSDADIKIKGNITAGSINVQNAKENHQYILEDISSGIYVDDGKNLTATDGGVVVKSVRDIVLGGDVSATGDIALIADVGEQYGGDVTANGSVTSTEGKVDISGNHIQINENVRAEGGNLTITGRTSEGWEYDYEEESFPILESYWGYIDVAEGRTLYASQNVKLVDAHGTQDNPAPFDEMDLVGHGSLTIEAAGGSIQTSGPIGEGVKITVENSSPASLTMKQAYSLNLAGYSFGNQNNTDLTLVSTDGSVTAVDSSQPLSGKDENAADQWASITAEAYTDITLQGHDASRDIKAGALTSNATGFDVGNISVLSENSKVLLTEDVKANNGSITITAIDPTNGGIVSSGDIKASDGITLFGEVTADKTGAQTFDAGQGTLWAKGTLSTITKTGEGKLTLAADTLVNLDGVDGSSGDSVDVKNGPLTIDGPVDAEGNLRATGVIQITGPAQLAGNVLSTGSGIIFEDDVIADGVGSQTFDAGTGQLIAENGVDIDKSTAGSLTLAGDAGIELGGNATGTGMTAADSLVFENNVTADGTGDAQDQRLDAGLGTLDAYGSIAKNSDGKLNLGGDEGIELGGNVETHNGDLTFEDAVTAKGTGNQRFDADGTGTDLIAHDDIIKNTDGKLTLGAGTGEGAEIYLAGDVKTSNGDLIFWDKVIANGTGNQAFDADGAGTDLIADDDIIKTTAGNLTLSAGTGAGSEIYLAGDVTTTDGDITLWDQVIANGSDSQRFDAVGGKLWATDTITKTTTGNLNLGGDDAIDLDGTVDVDAGSLTIEDDFSAAADLIASENVTLEGAATLDGGTSITPVNQKITAENGKFYASGWIHKTGHGNLDIFGGYNGPLGTTAPLDYSVWTHDVTVDNGELTIEGNACVRLEGDIYSLLNMWLTANADGIDSDVEQPGDIPRDYLIHYNPSTGSARIISKLGDIDMSAKDDVIYLDGGNNMPDAYVSAGGDILLRDWTWVQYSNKIDAGDDIVLAAGEQIQANGSLTLVAGDDIIIGSTDVDNHWLNPEDDTGTPSNIFAAGNMTLDATDDIYVHGKLTTTNPDNGDMLVEADDSIILFDDAESAGSMTLKAGWSIETEALTTTNPDNGDIDVHSEDWFTNIYGPVTSAGNLRVQSDYDDVELYDYIDVAENATIYAGGHIELATDTGAKSTIDGYLDATANREIEIYGEVETGGNLTLTGDDDGDNDGYVWVEKNLTAGGDIEISSSDWTTYLLGDHIQADGSVFLNNNTVLQGYGDQTIQAGNGTLDADGWVWKTAPGNLYLLGNVGDSEYTDAISLNNNRDSECSILTCLPAASTSLGNLEIYAENGDIQISGDLTTFGTYCYPQPGEFDENIEEGSYYGLEGWYDRSTGGVSVIADDGKIYTEGASPDNSVLNIGIVGNSDDVSHRMISENGGDYIEVRMGPLGVDLPDGEGKAAIVVMSNEDLKFGPDTMLIAHGKYDSTVVDDRVAVDFMHEPTTIDGIPRNEGDPIDVAVYVASEEGDVHLDGRAIDVADGGTMVVDAYDTVSFGDFETFNFDNFDLSGDNYESCVDFGCLMIKLMLRFGSRIMDEFTCDDLEAAAIEYFGSLEAAEEFLTALMSDPEANKGILGEFLTDFFGEGYFFNIDRLEVVSRITEWLYQASNNGTLPYPYNPEIVEAFIGGDYVLRGAGLDNPDITDGRAWVLEDPIPPAPLYTEAGEASDEEEFGEGGCPALMDWLAGEIGVPAEDIQVVVAGVFALSTDIQPCEMCARLKDASNIMEDVEGAQIAALARVVNEFVTTPAPPSPEQMTSIATALAEHVDDGTHYAVASQWIDAVVAYIGIMNAEMGYSAGDAAAFAEKYLTSVNESGNEALVAYVQARIAALGG